MSTDYGRLGAKTKFLQNVDENRRIAQAFPGIDQEVKQEIASLRMAKVREAKLHPTNGAGKRRGRKPGSKNKPKTGTTNSMPSGPAQTEERRNAVDQLSGVE